MQKHNVKFFEVYFHFLWEENSRFGFLYILMENKNVCVVNHVYSCAMFFRIKIKKKWKYFKKATLVEPFMKIHEIFFGNRIYDIKIFNTLYVFYILHSIIIIFFSYFFPFLKYCINVNVGLNFLKFFKLLYIFKRKI